MRRLVVLLLLPLLASGWAAAQPLAALAPVETLVALGWQAAPSAPSYNVWQGLVTDLERLGWERAQRTSEKLQCVLEPNMQTEARDLFRRVMKTCPGFKDAVQTDGDFEALLTVSASPYNPVPAVTATLRTGPEVSRSLADLQGRIVRCAERQGLEVVRLKEGDAPIFVLGNAGNFPVVIARSGSVFVAGSNPDVVRGTLRRAAGSDEANLAETPFYRRNRALLDGAGMMALNAAALGSTLESLGGALTDAQTEPLLRRAVAALRTLGATPEPCVWAAAS